jgi:hypothetical protein
MGKFGVGVGDEFPVDEGKPREDKPEGGRPEEHKEERDERCRHRSHDWHDRWREHARKGGGSRFWKQQHAPRIAQALIVIGGIALSIAIISNFIYVILGAAMVAVLAYAYRSGHHGAMWDMHPDSHSSEAQ